MRKNPFYDSLPDFEKGTGVTGFSGPDGVKESGQLYLESSHVECEVRSQTDHRAMSLLKDLSRRK